MTATTTTTTTTTIAPITQVIEALNFKGCRFAKINGYRAKGSGSLSNVFFNIGANYGTAKEKDILKLEKMLLTDSKAHTKETIEAVLGSLKNPSETHSKGQQEARVPIIDGKVFYFPETNNIIIWAKLIRNEVIEPGTYPNTKSRPDTIAKNKLRRTLESSKFRRYIIENIDSVRVNGKTIEIG